jgi:hypothetical protein
MSKTSSQVIVDKGEMIAFTKLRNVKIPTRQPASRNRFVAPGNVVADYVIAVASSR